MLDASALAHAYRRLVLWFGGQLLLSAASAAVGEGALISLGILVTAAALIYYGYRTAEALGSPVAWLWAVAMFLPCLNIITLLALSSKATRACRENGIPVGLLGPEI